MSTLASINRNELKKKLSHIILGQKGGRNRIQIIELIERRPYNASQLAKMLNLNYRTVKHHLDVLLENGFIESSRTGSYGEVFFPSPELETNIHVFKDIIKKLLDFTASPKFFQRLLERTNDIVIIIDTEYEVFFINNSALTLLEYKEDDILGENILLLPDEKEQDELFGRVIAGDQVSAREMKLRTSFDRDFDANVTVDLILDEEHNEIIGFSVFARDVSKQKAAEQALQRLVAIVEYSDDAIFSKQLDGTITSWNKGAEKIYGYTADEMVGESVVKLAPPDHHEEIFNILAKLEKGERIDHFKTTRVRKDGKHINISLSISPLADKQGNIIGASTIAREL